MEFTREIGGRLRAVTVEPAHENEAGVTRVPTGRSARLAQVIGELRAPPDRRAGSGGRLAVDPAAELVIRRGAIVEETTREIEDSGADVSAGRPVVLFFFGSR